MLPNEAKTKEQLINELAGLRQRNTELALSEAERTQVAERLQRSRDFLDHVFNSMSDALMVIDRDYSIIDVNNCFLKNYSISREETIGYKCYEVTHRSSRPCAETECFCPLRAVVETRLPVSVEHTHKDKYGKDMTVEIGSFPLTGPTGEVEYVVEIQNDITERRRTEEALRKSEQNFRNSLDSSPLGIRIVNAEGELLYANQAILDIYGYSSVEELKAVPTKQRYTPQSYAEHQERVKKRELGKPIPSSYEISIVRKNGEVRHLLAFRKEVIWGGEVQFQTLYQDITEHKQADGALQESEERYRHLFEELNDAAFLADVETGRILDANKQGEVLLVLSDPELEYRTGDLKLQRDQLELYLILILGQNFFQISIENCL